MIATVVITPQGPSIRVPESVFSELALHPGQRVRVDVRPLPWGTSTPLLEPDGTPA